MSTNQYQEMRNRQQAEVNAFPMFFAFNKQQFAEGMRKLGLSPSDTRQVCSIFGGGYCRKSDVAKLNEMFTRHRKELEDAIAGDKTGQGFICDMFLQELENHEYSYTGDVQETLDALGITAQYTEAQYHAYLDLFRRGREAIEDHPPTISEMALSIVRKVIRDLEADKRECEFSALTPEQQVVELQRAEQARKEWKAHIAQLREKQGRVLKSEDLEASPS